VNTILEFWSLFLNRNLRINDRVLLSFPRELLFKLTIDPMKVAMCKGAKLNLARNVRIVVSMMVTINSDCVAQVKVLVAIKPSFLASRKSCFCCFWVVVSSSRRGLQRRKKFKPHLVKSYSSRFMHLANMANPLRVVENGRFAEWKVYSQASVWASWSFALMRTIYRLYWYCLYNLTKFSTAIS